MLNSNPSLSHLLYCKKNDTDTRYKNGSKLVKLLLNTIQSYAELLSHFDFKKRPVIMTSIYIRYFFILIIHIHSTNCGIIAQDKKKALVLCMKQLAPLFCCKEGLMGAAGGGVSFTSFGLRDISYHE